MQLLSPIQLRLWLCAQRGRDGPYTDRKNRRFYVALKCVSSPKIFSDALENVLQWGTAPSLIFWLYMSCTAAPRQVFQ